MIDDPIEHDPVTHDPTRHGDNSLSDLPDEGAIIAFINECPAPPSPRDIARAFKLPQEQRAPLRRLLRAMAEEGKIDRREGRRIATPDQLPEVTVLELVSFDDNGDGMARPTAAYEGDLPEIRVILSRKAGRAPAVGQTILARLARVGPAQYEARIIRTLERQQQRLFGVVLATGKGFMLAPAERGKRQNLNLQTTPDIPCNAGDLVEAEMLSGKNSGYLGKSARVTQNLGPADQRGAFSALALAEFGIRHVFDDAVLAESENLRVPPVKGRIDLRDVPLVTIDGADARDFDDAVFAEPADDGGWRLLVAIADVAHYVRPGSALDAEARRRGNSVYLPDLVVPMLPEGISNDLCSLRPNEDRAAMVAEINIKADGTRASFTIQRALIKSHARLTYDQVQSCHDGVLDEADIGVEHGVLHNLFGAWRALDQARQEREPLALNLKERRVVMDDEGEAIAISQTSQTASQRLIEDFMITANVAAADQLISKAQTCVFRVHDTPDPKKTDSLFDLAASIGAPFAKGQVLRPRQFNQLLSRVVDTADEMLVNEAVLRSQAKAVYSIDNIGHFGLSLRNYAHFTSPIRRYSDLLVHRALIDSASPKKLPVDGQGGLSAADIAEICIHISETEASASAAERRTIDRFAAALFASKVTEIVDGVIGGITGFGSFIRLEDGAADGFMPLSGLPDDYYDLDAAGQTLTGRHNGWTFTVGTPLRVQIEEVTPVSGGILLRWIDGGTQSDNKRKKSSSKHGASQKFTSGDRKKAGGKRKKPGKGGKRGSGKGGRGASAQKKQAP